MNEMIERVAKAIYEIDPHYECGEYVEGFQVSPGGHLSWEQAVARDTESGDDPRMGKITEWALKAARTAIAAMRDPPQYMLDFTNSVLTDGRGAETAWKTMIDEILRGRR